MDYVVKPVLVIPPVLICGKYLNEDNKFGYLKISDVEFTPRKDKVVRYEDDDSF